MKQPTKKEGRKPAFKGTGHAKEQKSKGPRGGKGGDKKGKFSKRRKKKRAKTLVHEKGKGLNSWGWGEKSQQETAITEVTHGGERTQKWG